MLGGMLSSGALGGLEEVGAQLEGTVDEKFLIRVAGGPGLEKPIEGEVDGESGRGRGRWGVG